MIPYTQYIVDQHIESLVAEAARSRLIGKRGPSLRNRLVARVTRPRISIESGLRSGGPVVPALRDYPSEG